MCVHMQLHIFIHNVESKNMGLQYLEIGKMTIYNVIRKRLSLQVLEQDPLKAHAYNTIYLASAKGNENVRGMKRNLKKYQRKRRNG